MTTHRNTEITRPDAHSAKNARRAGAPNHLQGSGENAMVGTRTSPGRAADPVTVAFVRERLNGQAHRFMTVTRAGLAVNVADLAVLVADIVEEYADHVVAERDALTYELDAARSGRGVVA
jgi:hypothetical protein